MFLTDEGERVVEQTRPLVDELEDTVESGYTPSELATVRQWLVASAVLLSNLPRI